jgi:general secretion pathway protein J
MKPANSGFTLVELLVALTLASLVAMLAYGGLHIALRSWHAAELRQQQMELRYLTQSLLRRLLESPQAVSLRDDQGLQQMAFYGDEQQLIFTARLPALDDSEQLYWVQLSQEKQLTEQGLSWQLQMRYMPYLESEALNWSLLSDTLGSTGESEVLVAAMPQAWRFGYLERDPNGALDWQSQWQRQPTLPVLLRLTPPPRQRRDAAELLVVPRSMAYAIVKSR